MCTHTYPCNHTRTHIPMQTHTHTHIPMQTHTHTHMQAHTLGLCTGLRFSRLAISAEDMVLRRSISSVACCVLYSFICMYVCKYVCMHACIHKCPAAMLRLRGTLHQPHLPHYISLIRHITSASSATFHRPLAIYACMDVSMQECQQTCRPGETRNMRQCYCEYDHACISMCTYVSLSPSLPLSLSPFLPLFSDSTVVSMFILFAGYILHA